MAMASFYRVEAPPKLYMGVDYRRDSLFFKIPAARRTIANTSLTGPTTIECDESCVKHQQDVTEPQVSVELEDTFCIAMCSETTFASGAERQESSALSPFSDECSTFLVSFDTTHCGSVGRVEHEAKALSLRVAKRQPSRNLPPPLSLDKPGTEQRKGSAPPSAQVACPRGAVGLRFRATGKAAGGGGVILMPSSPQLTRSAILRREFNARDVSSRQSLGSFQRCVCKRSVFSHVPAAAGGGNGGNRAPVVSTHKEGFVGPRTQGGGVKLSSQRMKAAASCGVCRKRESNNSRLFVNSDNSSTTFGCSDVLANASHCTGGGIFCRSNESVKWQDEIPRVPELFEILALSARKESLPVDDKTVLSSPDAQHSAQTTLAAQTIDTLQPVNSVAEDFFDLRSSADSEKITPYEEDGNKSPLTDVHDGESGKVTTPASNSEKKPGISTPVRDFGAGKSCINSKEFMEKDVFISGISCADKVTAEPVSETLESFFGRDVSPFREGTLRPADVVETVYSFSSDAFSDYTSVTPHSLIDSDAKEMESLPLYERVDTLPMIGDIITGLQPPAVVADKDMLSLTACAVKESVDGVPTKETDFIHAGAYVLLEHELEREMSLVSRHTLLGNAPSRTGLLAQRNGSVALQKYVVLKQQICGCLLRFFFEKWVSWAKKTLYKMCTPVERPTSFPCGNGVFLIGGPAAPNAENEAGAGREDPARYPQQRGTLLERQYLFRPCSMGFIPIASSPNTEAAALPQKRFIQTAKNKLHATHNASSVALNSSTLADSAVDGFENGSTHMSIISLH